MFFNVNLLFPYAYTSPQTFVYTPPNFKFLEIPLLTAEPRDDAPAVDSAVGRTGLCKHLIVRQRLLHCCKHTQSSPYGMTIKRENSPFGMTIKLADQALRHRVSCQMTIKPTRVLLY